MAKIIIYYALLCFVFISCEKEVELDIPKSEPQVVVSSILIPGKNVTVNISLSNYVYDTENHYISDAEVKITSQNTQYSLVYTDSGRYVNNDIIVSEGITYFIEVNAPDYNQITAETTVPTATNIDSIQVKRNIGIGENGGNLASLSIFFNDNNAYDNYYQHNLKAISDSLHAFGKTSVSKFISYHKSIIEEGNEESKYFTNEYFDRSNMAMEFIYDESVALDWNTDSVKYTLYAQLLSISKEMYLYNKSLHNYYINQDNIWLLNNPPVLYSNIKNGYGIFASLSCSNLIEKRILDKNQ